MFHYIIDFYSISWLTPQNLINQTKQDQLLSVVFKYLGCLLITYSLHSSETVSILSYLQSIIIVKVSESLACAKGASPDTSLYKITPIDHTSE